MKEEIFGMYEYVVILIEEDENETYTHKGVVYSDSYANAMKKIEDYYVNYEDSTTAILNITLDYVEDGNLYEFNGLFAGIEVIFPEKEN